MNITAELMRYEEKEILKNLMELYNYDLSEFNDKDVNDYGLYGYRYLDHYWTEKGRYPYLIKMDSKIVGFALVRTTQKNEYSLAEFFIMKLYRRMGIGKEVAFHIFDLLPGKWTIRELEKNDPAQNFWRGIIQEYTNDNYIELREEGWEGPQQIFNSKEKNMRLFQI